MHSMRHALLRKSGMHWPGQLWRIVKGSQGKKATKATATVTNPDLNVVQYPGLTTANIEAVKARTKAHITPYKSHEDVTPCTAEIVESKVTKNTTGSDHKSIKFGTYNKENLVVTKNSFKVDNINIGNWALFDTKPDQLKLVVNSKLEVSNYNKVNSKVKAIRKGKVPMWLEKLAIVEPKFTAIKPIPRSAAPTRRPAIREKIYNIQLLIKSKGHTVFIKYRNQTINFVNISTSK